MLVSTTNDLTGYRITAVQRTDGYPRPLTARYPDGWQVTVGGPNVHRWPCVRPEWLDVVVRAAGTRPATGAS